MERFAFASDQTSLEVTTCIVYSLAKGGSRVVCLSFTKPS